MSCVLSSSDVESRAESATSNSSTAPVSRAAASAPLRMRTPMGTTTRQQADRSAYCVACERHSGLAFTEKQNTARADLDGAS